MIGASSCLSNTEEYSPMSHYRIVLQDLFATPKERAASTNTSNDARGKNLSHLVQSNMPKTPADPGHKPGSLSIARDYDARGKYKVLCTF
ncbi:hypothetical protein TNCT_669051 [Trichonephila clavata]|uniref:Uncharacterized protein n=1 Tax=Trichonephila clavata TaxID=2740835 RepID=A0A8X6FXB0_TRICU|nr:hypothetical protein TNCT_669051 [Trichonephila clavata]